MLKLKEYSFSSLYDIASGISSSKSQAGHGSPFVSFSTVFNNYFLPNEFPDLMDTSEKEQEIYSIKEGDILLTRTSETINELAMSCVVLKNYPKTTFSGFTKRLRPKPGTEEIVYHKYFGFYLRSYLFRKAVTNHSIMTLRSSFNEEIYSFLKIYLPEYEEQVKIGDFLYSIYQKIQINNDLNAELEKLAKTLYNYWFVQFDFPNDNGKPYRASGGKMEYSEVLKREIPKGWRAATLNEIIYENKQIISDENKKEDMLGLDLSIIPSNSFCLDQCGKASDFDSNRFILKKYDLLFGSIRPYLRKAGFSSFDGVVNGSVLNFRCKDNNIFSFALCTLTSEAMFKYAITRSSGNGTRMPTINATELLEHMLIYDEQIIAKFEKCLSPYWKIIVSNINQNFELIKLRDLLLPLLMNGQVKIKDDKKEIKLLSI